MTLTCLLYVPTRGTQPNHTENNNPRSIQAVFFPFIHGCLLFLIGFNGNQVPGPLKHHNKPHFWHFSVSVLEECSTQLAKRGATCRTEVSAGQTSGAGGGLCAVGIRGCTGTETRGFYEKVLFLSGLLGPPAEQGSCEDSESCWVLQDVIHRSCLCAGVHL